MERLTLPPSTHPIHMPIRNHLHFPLYSSLRLVLTSRAVSLRLGREVLVGGEEEKRVLLDLRGVPRWMRL